MTTAVALAVWTLAWVVSDCHDGARQVVVEYQSLNDNPGLISHIEVTSAHGYVHTTRPLHLSMLRAFADGVVDIRGSPYYHTELIPQDGLEYEHSIGCSEYADINMDGRCPSDHAIVKITFKEAVYDVRLRSVALPMPVFYTRIPWHHNDIGRRQRPYFHIDDACLRKYSRVRTFACADRDGAAAQLDIKTPEMSPSTRMLVNWEIRHMTSVEMSFITQDMDIWDAMCDGRVFAITVATY